MATAFERVKKMQTGIEWVRDNWDAIILDLVRDNEKEIIAMNVDDQLFKGINAKGEKIKPPYSPEYARLKRKKGLPSDKVTLRLEGDFHKAWIIKYGKKGEFEFDSKDFKKKFLIKRYGENIFGLTDNNQSKIEKMLEPLLIEIIKQRLLG